MVVLYLEASYERQIPPLTTGKTPQWSFLGPVLITPAMTWTKRTLKFAGDTERAVGMWAGLSHSTFCLGWSNGPTGTSGNPARTSAKP